MKSNKHPFFERFPKVRTPLPEKIEKIYSEHYKNNRTGGSPISYISQKIESWMHKKVSEDVVYSNFKGATLEIGAGTLNQLVYESIDTYDIVEPFKDLYIDSPRKHKIRNIYEDIGEIPANCRYDRVTSIAAFEHILDLPNVVATSALLLEPSGVLRVAIPNEGSWVWKVAYTVTTGIEFFIKYGEKYSILMQYEHVNTAKEIEGCLRFFFDEVEVSYFGISESLSLYHFYKCTKPKVNECRQFLEKS